MCISTAGFYYGTLEHHYVGELVLDKVNAVTDGAVAYSLLCFSVAYFGEGFMTSEISLTSDIKVPLNLSLLSIIGFANLLGMVKK